MKITIIDDDPDIIEVMRVLLAEAGHEINTYPAGANALSGIRRKRPDVVLTDLMMAEMDGLELCREVRADASLNNTKLIVISARTDVYWKKRATDAGAMGYIEKPIDPATIARDVEQMAAL